MRIAGAPVVFVCALAAHLVGCADAPPEGSACSAVIPERPRPDFGRAYYRNSRRPGAGSNESGDILSGGACRYLDAAKTVLVCGSYGTLPGMPDNFNGPQLTFRFARSPVDVPPGTVLRAGRHFTLEAMAYRYSENNQPMTLVDARAPIAGELVLTVLEAPAAGHDVQTMRGHGVLCAGAVALSFDLPFYDARRPSPPPLF